MAWQRVQGAGAFGETRTIQRVRCPAATCAAAALRLAWTVMATTLEER